MRRLPQRLRHTTTFPESFDAVMSINGIWGGCEDALVEANRVLRPAGMIGISFWGTGTPNDMRGCFKAFARHAPQQHFGSMKKLNNIAARWRG